MNKDILFILPHDNFNETELFVTSDVLKRAGYNVTFASDEAGKVKGDSGHKALATKLLDDLNPIEHDAVIVVGGKGTIDYLWDNDRLNKYLQSSFNLGVLVCGICAGSVVLAISGLLIGKRATCYKDANMISILKNNEAEYVNDGIINSGRIITADGPESAKEFALEILEELQSNVKKDRF